MANSAKIEVLKEEQVWYPVTVEFKSNIVEISSSSEKSSTGQFQVTGEEATSCSKRSIPQHDFSDESLCKKMRDYAPAEGSDEALGGVLHRGSMGLNANASNVTALNEQSEGANHHDGDIALDEVGVGDDDLPDDFLEPLDSPLVSSPPPGMHIEEPIHGHPSAIDMTKIMFNQFWKAGDYDNTPSKTDDLNLGIGMEHVRVHPKFLHSNATSHKWALGAIAELLDNSFDEAVNGATLVNVDMIPNPRDGRPMLMIEDDGGGMDPECMRQCMSLGYSAKSKVANTIGQYGNGFKTSTMRLGADVVVFSRHKSKDGSLPTQSIGLLSYTFLTGTGQDDIIVPMVDYEVHAFGLRKLVRGTLDDWNKNLETLLQWSPYDTEKAFLDQFKRIDCQGTIVIVYNLWEDEEGHLELDFDADPHDIQLRGANRDEKNNLMASKYPNCKHFFTHKYSLRSYASILYLRLPKKFKMFLRGEQVVHHKVVNDLMHIEQVKYKPVKVSVKSNRDAVTLVTLGFVKDAKEHIDVQGFNVYHKNRLIKPFWRVWNYPGIQGRGIFGVLEANFVEPAHDKQGFERTTVFARLEARLIEMQKSYWSKNCGKIGYVGNASKKKAPSKADGAGDPSSERKTYPGMSSPVSVNTRVSISLRNTQKSIHMASVVPEQDQIQAKRLTPGQSISSSGTKALPSQNKTQIGPVRAASPAPPLSGNMARLSSIHSPADLGKKEDEKGTEILHMSAASMPAISREALDIDEGQPNLLDSRQSETLRRVDRLKITPSIRVTRSQAIEEGRVQGVRSVSVTTVDTAQTCSTAVLSRNGDDFEPQNIRGLSDGLEVAVKTTSSVLTHTGATIDETEPESDSKDTQPTTLILERKDQLLSSNYRSALENDFPNLSVGNQAALVLWPDEVAGLHTSLTGDLVTHNASRLSLHGCLMSESIQDSNEALISPSSQCEAPESSQCTSGNVANGPLTSAKTQENRRRLTRSMLQLQQSHAKATQLESVNSQMLENRVSQTVIDGTTDTMCIVRTMPEEGDSSVSTLVATGADHTVSLEGISTLEDKLDVMKQRLRSLQEDLEQVYSERDFLKGELEEEQRRQGFVEEELKKRLQAVFSQARELEAANKLLHVCQR